MTQLSKLAILGIAKETVANTYLAPTAFIPFSKADFEDHFAEIKDNSFRANDTDLQGMYQGVSEADWTIDLMAYPDVTGHFLRGMIGPDTVTAGVSTTMSSGSTAGATTISTAASVTAQSIIMIDTGINLEYAKVTNVSGAGPYVLTVQGLGTAGGLQFTHASAATVVSQTTHTFKQSAARATYSLTLYDTTQTLGYAGAAFSDLDIKIDPKAAVTLAAKLKAFPGVVQSTMTPTYTALPPALGWQWNMINAGASSTRGLSYDLKIKRKIDVIHSSDGVQAPREIFQGALDAEGTYSAIFENQVDMNLYLNYTQSPTTATLAQPLGAGGSSLALTMSKSGYYKGKRDLAKDYVEAQFSLSGIYNTTDGGAVQATLANFVTAAY
ncbi:MAG: hypothetical protein JWO67_3193 [Streptosporangiaceae bacterium]|nr:hypothetical protein [Streptosporangiaceae bacterium]